jgi:predicted glycoside hydrolase/deacetylase ChbG (UPF0249 family)
MLSNRYLIINADDLGMSGEINQGILAAYDEGVITDSSLMIKMPYAREAVETIKKIPSFKVGIHADLDKLLGWTSPAKERLARNELHQIMDDHTFADKVRHEVKKQIEAFLDTGLTPSHIDTHHHVHGFLQIFEPLVEVAASYNIDAIRFNKNGYTLLGRESILFTDETRQLMVKMLLKKGFRAPHQLIDPFSPFSLAELPVGITELMVHPSLKGDQWRQKDFQMLLDPNFRKTIENEGIKLIDFSELKKILPLLT